MRVSTTDPEARKMKMPDGGFRPAYNVQFATTEGESQPGDRIAEVRVDPIGTEVRPTAGVRTLAQPPQGGLRPKSSRWAEKFTASPRKTALATLSTGH